MLAQLLFLFTLTLPFVINAGPAHPSNPSQPWCEYLLHDPVHIEDAMADLEDALHRTEPRKPIRLVSPLRVPTLEIFGLSKLRFSQLNHLELVTIKNDVDAVVVAQYDLILKEGGTELLLDREILPYPPVFAWLPLVTNEEEFEHQLSEKFGGTTYRLAPETTGDLTEGIIIAESLAYGRKFFSVDNLPDNQFLITLGIDVPCDQVEKFTFSSARVRIRAENGWLCRIPVLTATSTIRFL